MRDLRILILEDKGLDIDVIDGEAAYVEYESRTNDQRAALSVYAVRGTMPGLPDYGVSWADQYTQDNTVAQLSNQIQLQLQQEAGFSEGAPNTNSQYQAQILAQNDSVGVIITRG
jgi:hypothetical protein